MDIKISYLEEDGGRTGDKEGIHTTSLLSNAETKYLVAVSIYFTEHEANASGLLPSSP